ncbi:MAG: YlxR family protein [Acetivibrio sp.]
MSEKKVPLRQCIACGMMKDKNTLIRVIKTPENEIILDATGKKNGRGAYICNSFSCFEKAVKTKALERSLKVAIPQNIYETLEKELKELESK